ncbi:hypothetical protein [Pseudonocardia sp.]|uniref:hypothetical protein n=1 Tax=Pseudonocardia sp. TaxID=60912 RepID=UPI003D0E194E
MVGPLAPAEHIQRGACVGAVGQGERLVDVAQGDGMAVTGLPSDVLKPTSQTPTADQVAMAVQLVHEYLAEL